MIFTKEPEGMYLGDGGYRMTINVPLRHACHNCLLMAAKEEAHEVPD
jgi:hypothetical protein